MRTHLAKGVSAKGVTSNMTTDSTHFKGRLLSTHSVEVLRLRTLAQRLKDAQDAQTYGLPAVVAAKAGPLAVPTGTNEPPPQQPLASRLGNWANRVNPPGTIGRAITDYIGDPAGTTLPGYDPQQAAIDLQNAPAWSKAMMGMPVGAPAGSIAGTAGKGVLTQAGATLGRAIETGGVSAGIPKAAETVAARVSKKLIAYEVTVTQGTIKPKGGIEGPFERTFTVQAKTPAAAAKAVRDSGVSGDKVVIREKPIGAGQAEMPITNPAASEALSPAVKGAGATEATTVNELIVRKVPNPVRADKPYYRVYRKSDGVPLGGAEDRQAALENAQGTLRAYKEHPEWDILPKAPVEAKAVSESGGQIAESSAAPSTGETAAAGEAGIPSSAVPPKAIQGNLPPMKQGPRQPNFNAGPRAPVEPGPHTIMPPTKPPPPGELPPAPPSGEFPSGRKAPTLEEAAARATEPLPPVDNYQRLVESSRNPPSEPFVAKMREGAYKFLKGFTDRNQLLTKMSTSEGVSVHDLAQVVPGATLEGENVLRLKAEPIYQALGQKNIPYLQDYMVAMRDSDILARNPHAVLPGNVQGYQGVQESIAAIKAKVGDAELARIQLAAQARWNVQKAEVLDYAVSRGLLSETDAAAMTSAHPHYIPFMRTDWVEALDAAYAAGTKPEASLSSLGLQQMDLAGSTRNLENPLARMDAQIIKIRRMNARNEAAKGIADSLEEMQKTSGVPLIHYLEPAHLRTDVNLAGGVKQSVGHLQTPEGTVPGTISFIKNGEHYIAEVPEEYAAVAKGMGEEPPDGVTRLAGLMNAPLKLGATGLNTAFIPVNAVRDAQSAYFNAGLSPFSKYYWQGVQASWFKNDLFNEAVNVRAMGGGFVESMRPASAISRAQSQFYGALRVHTVQDALLAIPRSIERLNVNVERGTRIGVYAKAKAEGLSDLEAAVKARNATADFSKAGTTMKIVNQWIPFSNAAVQGTAASVMRVKGHPWQAAAAAAPFLAMTALSRANNMRFDSYNSIPDYVFNNNWVLQYGEVTHKDGTVYPVYVTVPKGQFISAVVFPLEAMFNQARKTNDKTVAQNLMQAGLGAAQNISPVSDVSSVVPAPLQAYIEVKANKDFYTGQPIVSQSQQNLPTEQQFGPGTSKTAIALGHAFNISPLLIEHAIQATTGGAGQQVAWLAGLGLQVLGYNLVPYGSELSKNTKETSVPEQLGTIPGIKRFVGTKNTKETLAGWDDFNAAVADTNSQFAKIPTMNGLGIRLGSVGDSLAPPPRLKGDSRQLTPKERAQYQTLMAQQVIAGLTAFVDKMDMTQPPDDRRTLIAKEMGTLKKAAAASFNDVLLSAKPTLKERLSQRTATPTPKMMTLRERLALSATPMPEPVGATP